MTAPANDFLTFGTAGGANIITQSAYAALAQRGTGFGTGLARSDYFNKVWRQSAFVAAALSQFMADATGQDVLDQGTVSVYVSILKNALKANGYEIPYAVAGGTANALTLTLPGPAITAYAAGQVFSVKATAANTGAATINVSGLGAKSILYGDGSPMDVNAWTSGAILLLEYNGTEFQLLSVSAAPRAAVGAEAFIWQAQGLQ